MRHLALLLVLLPALARAEVVRVPGPDGVMLNADLFPAQGATRGAAIVALHGCSGPYPSRDNAWAHQLAAAGHTVLLPDSFGSRGLASQCSARSRPVTANGLRRQDAIAALRWLAERPGTPPGGLVLMGWADGGSTVLTAGRKLPDLPAGLIRGMVALYPVCRVAADTKEWAPAAPLLILIGESEEWTPSAPCHVLADKLPGRVTLVTYTNTYHEFDAPSPPVLMRRGKVVPTPAMTHAGMNEAARADAMRRVPAFIAALP